MVRSMTVASRLYAARVKAGPAVTRDVDVRRDVAVRAPDGDLTSITEIEGSGALDQGGDFLRKGVEDGDAAGSGQLL